MLPTRAPLHRVLVLVLFISSLLIVVGGSMSARLVGAAPSPTASRAPAPEQGGGPAPQPGAPRLTRPAPDPTGRARYPAAPAMVLYDSFSPAGQGSTSSQNFEPSRDVYDDQAADDFVVPAGQTWNVDLIDVAGTYSGTGTADSINVFFYSGTGSLPGTPVLTRTNVLYNPGLNPGDFAITLNPPVLLPAGTYWLSVQANQPLDPAGQWFWLTSETIRGWNGVYRNPGGGFATGCPDWGYCGYSFYQHDHMFRLGGLAQTPATATGTPPTATPSPTPRTPTPSATGTLALPSPVLTQPAPFYSATPTATLTPIPSCGLAWRLVPSPNINVQNNRLQAVTALAANDLWTVGFHVGFTYSQTLIEHWDGQAWSIVPSPNSGPASSQLEDIAAVAPDDIWAVGESTGQGYAQTLIEHWDGQVWSVVPSPNPVGGNYLYSVSARAANDIWAVGGTDFSTLTLHWDGQTWSVVPSPNQGTNGSTLQAVSARAANDVWAVGFTYITLPFWSTLTMHWDGTAWTIIPSPNPGSYDNSLRAVTALSANDVWAVGTYEVNTYPQTLTLHWDGQAWTVVPSPNVPATNNVLEDVVAIGPNDIWAVGGGIDTLTLHWDGTNWSIVDSLSQSRNYELLTGVAAVNSRDVWTVGYYYDDTVHDDLTQIEHYHDPCATPTPSGTPTRTVTGTPPTATRTPTLPPTSTRTATPPRPPTHTPTQTPPMTYTATPTPTCDPSGTYRILLVHSGPPAPTVLQTQLLAEPGISGVDFFDASVSTPALSLLQQYALVVAVPQASWFDPAALGNTFADYHDGGGILVATFYSFHTIPGSGITGRWLTGGYPPYGYNNVNYIAYHHLGSYNANEPLMQGITALESIEAVELTLAPGGVHVAAFNNLPEAVAYKATNGHVAIGITGDLSNNGNLGGDWGRLIANAARWLAPPPCAPSPTTTARPPTNTPTGTPTRQPGTPTVISEPTQTATRATTATPTNTVTITPGGPTRTPVPPTATYTPCALQFTDVPSSNTFYVFVRCLACRGIVGGYPCGGPGEPCPGPYFRPNNNVTRGQVSKIVSESAGFTDAVPNSQQTFADVPPSGTFWLWVERLSGRGIIGGYPCGSPGEPCIGPTNRPYFRPNNNATRSQMSKIAALAFFPNCATPARR